MPLDNVLLRFAGAQTTNQTQSLSGGRASDALPAKLAKYDFDMENITGDYPPPGIKFDDTYPGDGTWTGYQNFRIEITVIANHGTGTYNIRFKVRLPTSGTDDYTYTGSTLITVPSGFTASDELIFLYRLYANYLRLKVTLSELQETAGTTYVFFVPGALRNQLPAYKAHTGGYLSPLVPTHGVDSARLGAAEHCLQLISIRAGSPAPIQIGYGVNSGGYISARIAGTWKYGTAGDLNFTGGVKYIRYEEDDAAIVFRYDTDIAARTVQIDTFSGAQARFGGQSLDTGYVTCEPRPKNELFPPAYRNITTYRGFFLENITDSEIQVYLSIVGSADGLWFSRTKVAEPDAYWLIGDGITTGIPPAVPTVGSLPIDNTPSGPIVIPARQLAGMRFSFESSSTTSVESYTQLLVLSA